MIRGVVFDLDHTLFDRYGTLQKVLPSFYALFRDNIPADLPVESFVERFIPLEKKYILLGWDKLLQACTEAGLLRSYTDHFRKETIDFIFHHFGEVAVPYSFAAPTLISLRNSGLKVGIITNGTSDLQFKKIRLLDLEKYTDEILISGDIGIQKPNPEPFHVMSQRLGIPAEELIYVGDHPINDIDGSRNAGYTPVWVKTTGYWCFEEIPRAEYEVETVAEIPDLVAQINRK